VGKVLLAAELPDLDAVRRWVADAGPLVRRTDRTVADAEALHSTLEHVRDRGYAVDDQENEPGINCLAVPAWLGPPTRPSGAVSVSAVAYRTPLSRLVAAVSEIRSAVPSAHPRAAPSREETTCS
jgi:DNA-binding IclR family transcriptional regulator